MWADENGIACFKCWSRGCSTKEIVVALGVASALAKSAPRRAEAKTTNEGVRIERALEIWRAAREPRGTIVHDYLFGRGWTGEMPTALCVSADPAELARAGIALAIPSSIRFHPMLWYAPGVYLPAMIAAIENRDGCIVGVHRTYLKPDGTGKAEVEPNKKALGRARGCAVHLTAGAPELVLCEGVRDRACRILQATGDRSPCDGSARHVRTCPGSSKVLDFRQPRQSPSRPITTSRGSRRL